MSLTIKKHDIRIFRDCIRSDLEKRDIENRQKKKIFADVSKKYSLCSGIYFYETARNF